MTAASGAQRQALPAAVVLLAAVLTALGLLSAPYHDGPASAAESRGAGTAVDVAVSKAIAPVRAAGRLAAEPSLLGVHGHGDLSLLGALPSGAASTTLLRPSGRLLDSTPQALSVHRVTTKDRAPPSRSSDL